MKKNILNTLQTYVGRTLRIGLLGLWMTATLAVATNIVQARSLPWMPLDERALSENYYAWATLSPAASGAYLVVTPDFYGYEGFEDAHLNAWLSTSGVTLTVELAGFRGDELPEGATLGTVTVVESSGNRTYEVKVDGGILISELGDL